MKRDWSDGTVDRASIRRLNFYRAWIIRIINDAERRTPAAEREAGLAIEDLLDRLNAELLSLYRHRESVAPEVDETTALVSALERIRNILRFRSVRKRSFLKTLSQAVADQSQMPP